MSIVDYESAINILAKKERIPFDQSFDISKLCSKYLMDDSKAYQARDIIIRIQDAWDRLDVNTHSIWNDLTEAAGLYPYTEPQSLSGGALLRYEYHKSDHIEDVYLHQEQQILINALMSKESVVVSAPTSFGKSLLIQEVVASKVYRNIVIIQPTLALLDETRKKLLKYKRDYKIIVSTNQSPDTQRGNIFLFTGERVVEYTHFPPIDFFVIDEFYKLSMERDDDRAISLNQAFHKLLKSTNKFYLLGPMIKGIPDSFSKKFKFNWFPTTFATVAVDVSDIEFPRTIKANEKKQQKKQKLYELLSGTSQPTLIYCSSPNRATQLCSEFIEYLKGAGVKPSFLEKNKAVIDWISENLNNRWVLNEALEFGAAFHHGALPRHLGSSIVDLFNEETVKWLFCTSTLIEGVNTSAKNVVLFDKEKGSKPIDFFDYKNITGRTGRMKKHFIGNVIRFEKEPVQMDLMVDIPLFNQENAPLEVLVMLGNEEVEAKAKPRLQEFNNLPDALQKVLRRNSSISIEGQLEILKTIESNLNHYHRLLNWNNFPDFDSLAAVIELCWNNLPKKGESVIYIDKIGRLSPRWLTGFTFSYTINKSTKSVINQYVNEKFWIEKISNEKERINIATFSILHITRHWFDYKLPKWLAVMSDLQEYVFTKNNLESGNYLFLASSLEHGFLNSNLAALTEYNIPISALNKLTRIPNFYFGNDTSEEIVARLMRMTEDALFKAGLLPYEIDKIKKAF
jgi:late competence protein required for DNA uptake (superfamily II DNA/RNA helicase)